MTAPTDPSNVPATNPPPVDTPPAQPAQPSAPQRQPVIVQSDNSSVLNAVNALPERLVDAVRELIPQSPPPSTGQNAPQTDTPTPPATPTAQSVPARRRSPGEWFFGINKS
jgi:hypothetical protein